MGRVPIFFFNPVILHSNVISGSDVLGPGQKEKNVHVSEPIKSEYGDALARSVSFDMEWHF